MEEVDALELGVNRFCNRIEALIQKGLPNIYVINDKLITQEDYVIKMKEVARSSVNFSGIKGNMTTKAFLEIMSNGFYIQNEVKHFFYSEDNFCQIHEVDEIYRRVIKLTILDEKRWEEICDLLD